METRAYPRQDIVPLMPTQAWALERANACPNEFNLVEVFEVSLPFDAASALEVTARLMRSHEAFGLRFKMVEEGWEQRCDTPDPHQAFAAHDLSGTPQEQWTIVVSETIAEAARKQNLSRGPLFQVLHFSAGLGLPSVVAFIGSHLIVDYMSMHLIVLEFFNNASSPVASTDHEHPSPTQFTTLARYTDELSKQPKLLREANYWLTNRDLCQYDMKSDFSNGNQIDSRAGLKHAYLKIDRAVTAALTQLLRKTHKATVETALTAAFASSVRNNTGDRRIAVNLWNHGRLTHGGFDLARTVGVVSHRYRAFVDLDVEQSPSHLLGSVKEQLSNVPSDGVGYGLLRYGQNHLSMKDMLTSPTEGLVVNFFGRVEPVTSAFFFLRRIDELSKFLVSDANRSLFTIRMGAALSDVLDVNLLYSEAKHKPETIDAMLQHIRWFLERLAGRTNDPACAGSPR
jgi:non-ribosomal peptide synthase protein (TIGR01720 family)